MRCTRAELARALGLSRQRVHQLVHDPEFPPPGRDGRWDLAEVCAWRAARTPAAKLRAALAAGPLPCWLVEARWAAGLRELLASGEVEIVPRTDRANGRLVRLTDTEQEQH